MNTGATTRGDFNSERDNLAKGPETGRGSGGSVVTPLRTTLAPLAGPE